MKFNYPDPLNESEVGAGEDKRLVVVVVLVEAISADILQLHPHPGPEEQCSG